MSAIIYRGVWYASFRYMGKRYTRKSPLNTKHAAEMYERELLKKLMTGQTIGVVKEEKKKTVREFAQEWFKTYVEPNNKLSEQINKISILKNHILPYFGDKLLEEITTRDIEEFKRQQLSKISPRLKKPPTPKSINNHLTVLKKMFGTAIEWGVIETAPVIKLLKVPQQEMRYLNDQEIKIVLEDKSEPFWTDMARFAMLTGLRLGELLALRWEHIDFQHRCIHIKQSLVCKKITTPKSNKFRMVPMVAFLEDELVRYRKPSGYVFTLDGLNPVSTDLAGAAMKRMVKRSGLPKFSWHAFRHTFASLLVRRDRPIYEVKKLLGHADIRTTERYAHLAPDALGNSVTVFERMTDVFGNNTVTAIPTTLIPA